MTMKEQIQATYQDLINAKARELATMMLTNPEGSFTIKRHTDGSLLQAITRNTAKRIAQAASHVLGVKIDLTECVDKDGIHKIDASINLGDLDPDDAA